MLIQHALLICSALASKHRSSLMMWKWVFKKQTISLCNTLQRCECEIRYHALFHRCDLQLYSPTNHTIVQVPCLEKPRSFSEVWVVSETANTIWCTNIAKFLKVIVNTCSEYWGPTGGRGKTFVPNQWQKNKSLANYFMFLFSTFFSSNHWYMREQRPWTKKGGFGSLPMYHSCRIEYCLPG